MRNKIKATDNKGRREKKREEAKGRKLGTRDRHEKGKNKTEQQTKRNRLRGIKKAESSNNDE